MPVGLAIALPGTAAVAAPAVDVALSSVVMPATVRPGQDATLTVTARNDTTAAASGVRVAVPLPGKLAVVRATPSRGTVERTLWSVGELPARSAATLTLVLRGTGDATVTTVASLVGSSPPDTAAGNDVASSTLRVGGRTADLAVTTVATAPSGAEANYRITVTNRGPDPASGVVLREVGPAAVVAATPSHGSYDPIGRVWTIGDVPLGAAPVLMVRAVEANLRSAVLSADTADPVTADNAVAAVAAAPGTAARLAVAATAGAASVGLGQTVAVTVEARNAGPVAADGVVVTTTLPPGLDAVSSSGPGGYDLATGVWEVGGLAPGATVTRQVVARATRPGQHLAAATLTAADPPDGAAADNVATAPVEVTGAADLALTRTVTRHRDGSATYETTVTNKGPGTATDVEVVDPAVAGAVLSSATSLGTTAGLPAAGGAAAVRWRVGTLTPDVAATWRLTLRAPARPGAVVVTQTGSDDPAPADNAVPVARVLTGANLAVSREVNNTTPTFGQEVEFTVTVTNAGPEPARGVTVTDPTDGGLAFVAARPGQGTYDGEEGRWAVGDLAAGAEATLTLRARVARGGEIPTRSTISAAAPADPSTADNTADLLLTATDRVAGAAPVVRAGIELPFTDLRVTIAEALIAGALLIAGGFALLLHLRR